MANKIKFHQLVAKVQAGTLTPQQMEKYFIVNHDPTKPFDPNPTINIDNVDVTNVERLASATNLLARDQVASAGAADFESASSTVKKWIVAEGDSWFNLPDGIMPPTLIDVLQDTYPIINIARWGDTLTDMISRGEYWSYIYQHDVRVLLFSGGGNDVLGGGELASFLNLYDVDHTQPKHAPYYVKQAFYDNLNIVIANLEGLIGDIKRRAPKVKIVHHGYDYAIPQQGGPWLGGPMGTQGLDPFWSSTLCKKIVELMIDEYNLRLKGLQARHPDHYQWVDLRKTLGNSEWIDELHPKTAAARRLAGKVGAALNKLPDAAALKAEAKKLTA